MMRFLVMLAVLSTVISLPVLGASPANEPPLKDPEPSRAASNLVDAKVAEASEPLKRGDYVKANALLLEAQRLDPHSPAPLLGLAEVSMRQGRTEEVKARLDQAFKLAPRDARVSSALGRFYQSRAQFPDAEYWLKNAIGLNPNAPRLQCDLADLYLSALNKPELAASTYSSAIKLDATYPGGYFGLGRALMKLNRWWEAERNLQKAVDLAPNSIAAGQSLGELFAYQKDYAHATEQFTRVLKIEPRYVPALVARGEVSLGQDNAKAAIEDFDAVIKLTPRSDTAYVQRGRALEVALRFDDAKRAYQEALKRNPDNAVALNNLAWLMLKGHEDLSKAEILAAHAVQKSAETAEFHDTLGAIYRAEHKLADAERSYRRALELKGSLKSSAEALREMGAKN